MIKMASKIPYDTELAIVEMRVRGATVAKTAEHYSVSRTTVADIMRRQSDYVEALQNDIAERRRDHFKSALSDSTAAS